MQKCVWSQYPNATVKYVFKCRNEGVKLGFLCNLVTEQVQSLSQVQLSKEEAAYLGTLNFLTDEYVNFLKEYRFDPAEVCIDTTLDGDLVVEIEGGWCRTILWEVPLLAIINQLYFQERSDFRSIQGEGIRRLKDKINIIRQYPTLTFAEFGTRRRYSKEWQEYVAVELSQACPQMVGTSNVTLAMKLGKVPIGTMAHEFVSCHLSLVDRLHEAQKRCLHVWLQEFGTDLGIALSDTFTTKAFFSDFGLVLSREFQGIRQDSGDPVDFGENAICHYKSMGIDPKTKTVIFSDGLDTSKMIDLYKRFVGRIGVSFGVGTHLTNDFSCSPLNIVIKAVECNGCPVVKLSDDPSKAIGDPSMVERVKLAYRMFEEKAPRFIYGDESELLPSS